MRLFYLTLFCLLVPGASACSIALSDLNDVDVEGKNVVVQRGTRVAVVDWGTGLERTLSEDFFPRFAAGPDGRVLVAAQKGLGADCSGDNYVALYTTAGKAKQWSGQHAIAAWDTGFLVADGEGKAYDWQGNAAGDPGVRVAGQGQVAASDDGTTFITANQGKATVWSDGKQVAHWTRTGGYGDAVAVGRGAAHLSIGVDVDQELAQLHVWRDGVTKIYDLPGVPSWPTSLSAHGGAYWMELDRKLWRFDPEDESLTSRTFDNAFVGGVASDGERLVVGLTDNEYGETGLGLLRIHGAESFREAPDGRGLWALGTVPTSQSQSFEAPGEPVEGPMGPKPTPGLGPLALLGVLATARARRK